MSTETEIRDFLTTRRAKLTPERVGLPTFGRQRRVAGLRREEVALLAGISVEYYTRLERGNARGVSDSVLDSVADALQLNEAERDHLVDLARTANAERPPRRTAAPQKVRPSIARIIDSMTGVAATVRNARLDTLYANELGRALFSDLFARSARPEHGPLHVLRPALAPVLAGLGARRERHRRGAPRRGGPEPVRPGTVRPHRGAVDPQRGVPRRAGPPTT